ELREADVVADGQPDRPPFPAHDHGLFARFLRLRLAVDVTADLDVEEVDLAVEAEQLAVGPEDQARVRELLAPVAALGDRPANERDPVTSGPVGHRSDG